MLTVDALPGPTRFPRNGRVATHYEIVHRVRAVEWFVRDRRAWPLGPRFVCGDTRPRRFHTIAASLAAAREIRDAYIDFDTGGIPDRLEGKVILRKYKL